LRPKAFRSLRASFGPIPAPRSPRISIRGSLLAKIVLEIQGHACPLEWIRNPKSDRLLGARARISPFWLRLRVAPVLAVHAGRMVRKYVSGRRSSSALPKKNGDLRRPGREGLRFAALEDTLHPLEAETHPLEDVVHRHCRTTRPHNRVIAPRDRKIHPHCTKAHPLNSGVAPHSRMTHPPHVST